MFTEEYLEPSRTSSMELFFTLVKPYFKNVLNLIKLLLGSFFLHNSPFREKTYHRENFERKSLLLTMKLFFRNSKLRIGMAS